MCNTTCNNHSHEEYNVDYIENEQTLDIQTENVPCGHEQNIYIVRDDEDECNCKCNECDEPKKVSCRSLACQQLNDECSCKRKKKKIRKTTMVNVLENNVMRLEDKMNDGCASMHENIEELEDNINKVYNELKDEETRAKLQEAFLHYGLDDAVTRAEYDPQTRKIYFYHKNPLNCLNVNVHEGCDCDCCNACGCECKCNTDECSSDIPYTMDDECNIVPMTRDEEKLPFEIDCRDFLRDIFVEHAYIEDQYPDDFDGEKDGPFLIIEFRRYFEKDLEVDPDQTETPEQLRIDLSKIWKLKNYYDKNETRQLIKKLRIINTYNTADFGGTTTLSKVVYYDEGLNGGQGGDVELGYVDIKMPGNPAAGLQEQITNLGDTINNLDIPGETTVDNKGATLYWGDTVVLAEVNGTAITAKMPNEPLGGGGDIPRHITNITQEGDTVTFTWSDGDTTNITVGGGGSGDCLWEVSGDGVIPKAGRTTYSPGFYDTTVS